MSNGRRKIFRTYQSQAQAGFVQVLVIGGLVIVSSMISVGGLAARGAAEKQTLLLHRIETSVAGSSGIERLVAAIADVSDRIETRLTDNAVIGLHIGTIRVDLAVDQVAGKIDLLHADRRLVESYVRSAGLPSSEMRALQSSIDAARLANTPHSALTAFYRSLLPFRSFAELDQDVSVDGTSSGVDPKFASERVLRSIPGLSSASVRSILDSRGTGRPITESSAFFSTGTAPLVLVAMVDQGSGEAYSRRTAIQITAAGSVSYLGPAP